MLDLPYNWGNNLPLLIFQFLGSPIFFLQATAGEFLIFALLLKQQLFSDLFLVLVLKRNLCPFVWGKYDKEAEILE